MLGTPQGRWIYCEKVKKSQKARKSLGFVVKTDFSSCFEVRR
jgi:hypothetical protein